MAELPVPYRPLRGFAEHRQPVADPGGLPLDELAGSHLGAAEELQAACRVAEQRCRLRGAGEAGLAPEQLRKPVCHLPDLQELRTGHIEREHLGAGMSEAAEHHLVRVALPDHVDVSGGERDRLPGGDAGCDVGEHPVAQVDGVVETDHAERGAPGPGRELEHPLPSETGLRIFPDGSGRRRLGGTAALRGDEGVDVARRQRRHPGAAVAARHPAWQRGVDLPRPRLIVPGPELRADQVDHLGGVRQRGQVVLLDQVEGEHPHPRAG